MKQEGPVVSKVSLTNKNNFRKQKIQSTIETNEKPEDLLYRTEFGIAADPELNSIFIFGGLSPAGRRLYDIH